MEATLTRDGASFKRGNGPECCRTGWMTSNRDESGEFQISKGGRFRKDSAAFVTFSSPVERGKVFGDWKSV